MFDSLALAFHSKFDGYGREPRIVLVTAINPKIVSGSSSCNVAEQGTTSDGPLAGLEAAGKEGVAGLEAAGKEGVDLEESARKKARVE
ncbi:unnamed protein product [Brassica napus]|uniref:(rape) hypothetical protein n=1 Tax=Brassica napus TaxID=3708 RepID=A0A816NZ51_BRANA|nr:unnamed protein product [Brassica napus]